MTHQSWPCVPTTFLALHWLQPKEGNWGTCGKAAQGREQNNKQQDKQEAFPQKELFLSNIQFKVK